MCIRDSEAVEAVAKMCAEHVGDDVPEAMLAGTARPVLTHLVVLLSQKLAAARLSVETLLAEREAEDGAPLPPGPGANDSTRTAPAEGPEDGNGHSNT